MSSIKFWCCVILCVLILETTAINAMSDENKDNCSIDVNNEMRWGRKINLNVHTNFKDEISTLREMIKAEFAQLRAEMLRQKEDLTSIKTSLETFIKTELQTQKEKVTNELKTVFNQKFDVKNQELFKNINETISDQLKNQEKTFENELRSLKPHHADLRKWDVNFNCTENCGPIMDLPRSCQDAMDTASSRDGVYLLNIENSGLKPFYAYCQRIDNKIWTVMQRREDGSVDFYRNWQDYKHGFGNLYGEFWLGLERLNALTGSHQHELHIWMQTQNGTSAHAHYSQFSIGNETDKYRLSLSGYSGNVVDLLDHHKDNPFSTYDQDNDKGSGSCSESYKGGWWFTSCFTCHLNARYNDPKGYGVEWYTFSRNLKFTRMAIREF